MGVDEQITVVAGIALTGNDPDGAKVTKALVASGSPEEPIELVEWTYVHRPYGLSAFAGGASTEDEVPQHAVVGVAIAAASVRETPSFGLRVTEDDLRRAVQQARESFRKLDVRVEPRIHLVRHMTT